MARNEGVLLDDVVLGKKQRGGGLVYELGTNLVGALFLPRARNLATDVDDHGGELRGKRRLPLLHVEAGFQA